MQTQMPMGPFPRSKAQLCLKDPDVRPTEGCISALLQESRSTLGGKSLTSKCAQHFQIPRAPGLLGSVTPEGLRIRCPSSVGSILQASSVTYASLSHLPFQPACSRPESLTRVSSPLGRGSW